jgi:hypothetical protein
MTEARSQVRSWRQRVKLFGRRANPSLEMASTLEIGINWRRREPGLDVI